MTARVHRISRLAAAVVAGTWLSAAGQAFAATGAYTVGQIPALSNRLGDLSSLMRTDGSTVMVFSGQNGEPRVRAALVPLGGTPRVIGNLDLAPNGVGPSLVDLGTGGVFAAWTHNTNGGSGAWSLMPDGLTAFGGLSSLPSAGGSVRAAPGIDGTALVARQEIVSLTTYRVRVESITPSSGVVSNIESLTAPVTDPYADPVLAGAADGSAAVAAVVEESPTMHRLSMARKPAGAALFGGTGSFTSIDTDAAGIGLPQVALNGHHRVFLGWTVYTGLVSKVAAGGLTGAMGAPVTIGDAGTNIAQIIGLPGGGALVLTTENLDANTHSDTVAYWLDDTGAVTATDTLAHTAAGSDAYPGVGAVDANGNVMVPIITGNRTDNAITVRLAVHPAGGVWTSTTMFSGAPRSLSLAQVVTRDAGEGALVSWVRYIDAATPVLDVAGYDGGAAPSVTRVEVPAGAVAGTQTFLDGAATDFSPITIHWDLGDGRGVDGARVPVTWNAPGTYRVTMHARDAAGNETTRAVSVAVAAASGTGVTAPKPVLVLPDRIGGRVLRLRATSDEAAVMVATLTCPNPVAHRRALTRAVKRSLTPGVLTKLPVPIPAAATAKRASVRCVLATLTTNAAGQAARTRARVTVHRR
ncbi:MAG: PKD domain-containing protein [Thermoleophilia bacterium]